MPVKKDAIIWKTLLSACKIHKNADIAKRIAEEVLRLDPPYVLLSNIQASAKRWQYVSEVRKVMRDRRVQKEPGIGWFEAKNQVHQFCMGDKSHPQSMEIDMYLKEITWEMKLLGYVPDTSSVLHDMDAEEKEHNLAHHSEKFAIAFALMNTPEGVPIRVMKNLRFCSDCHVAIKYILETENREIICVFPSIGNNNDSNGRSLVSEDNSTTVRAILSRRGSVEFVCGFYCFGSCTYYLFSVAIVGGGNQSVVWSTNVGHSVKEGATLQLTVDGELGLRNSDGDHVWSTNTLGKSVVGMNMPEWGNLVLFNNKGAIVWQSFDYPANTLLVGQRLYEDQKVISSSSNLWACGLCFAALKLATSFVTYIGVRNVSYFNLIDEDAAFPNIIFFRYNNNVSDGYCYIPSTVLTIREGLIPNHSFASATFVKVQIPYKPANGQVEGTVPDTSPPASRRNLKAIIARSCAEDFKERLGGGTFGTVFKGMLEDGTQIAAKRLDKLGQGMKEFFAEVETLGHVHHANLVRLIGFCAEKSCRLLVYEYVTNGSIGKGRKKIILHIAKGLERAEYQLLDMVENMDEGVKQYHAEEVVRMIKIGAWCLQIDQSRRPSMSIVVKVLEGLMEVDININYNFTYATASSSTVNNHASTAPPASALSNPRWILSACKTLSQAPCSR
ncbi:unnamed protein product [Camellia sinensis]